jgi:hypothetical protein
MNKGTKQWTVPSLNKEARGRVKVKYNGPFLFVNKEARGVT